MKNYKLIIQYEGTKYNGWQKQGNTKNTIQERFENVLEKMTGRKIEINASGRTDAGVHAKGQTANFRCDIPMSEKEIMEYINRYLPEDIAVLSVEVADERFHARLNAKSKTYEYVICRKNKPDVFTRRTMYKTDKIPDCGLMRKAAQKLVGTHDFKGFSSLGKTKKSTVRTINSIDIIEEGYIIKIVINGSGFLYNMVRIISGTLYEIGIEKKDIDCIDKVFETKNREYAGITFPPNGLTLKEVFY